MSNAVELTPALASLGFENPTGDTLLLRLSGDWRTRLGTRKLAIREAVQGAGCEAITAAMSRAVEALSREIATLPELRGAAP